jgi:capsular polysaccharide biosynthesis protein
MFIVVIENAKTGQMIEIRVNATDSTHAGVVARHLLCDVAGVDYAPSIHKVVNVQEVALDSTTFRETFANLSPTERVEFIMEMTAGHCPDCGDILRGPCHCEK